MLKKALYNIDHIDDLNQEINQTAQEGYELAWIGIFMHFQKHADAETYRYRAEPCGLLNTELLQAYREAGWETVKGRFRGITVFRTNHPDVQPVLAGKKELKLCGWKRSNQEYCRLAWQYCFCIWLSCHCRLECMMAIIHIFLTALPCLK